MRKFLCLTIVAMLCCGQSFGKPEELKKSYIKEQVSKVIDWQLENFKVVLKWRNTEVPVTDWVYAPFVNGMFAAASVTGADNYIDKLVEIGNDVDWGLVETVWPANDHATPQTWLELYEVKGDAEMIEPTKRELDKFMEKVEAGDTELTFTTPNFHKWSWCDALYMSPPAFVRLAAVTGDQKYLDFTHKWWKLSSDLFYDRERQLFYRDHKEKLKREANGEPVFWCRGLGWVVGGLVRVLQYLPEDDPHRDMYIAQLQALCKSLKELQQPYGLWASGLLDPTTWTHAETSGSGLILYAMAYGVNEGILDKKEYRDVIESGWIALCKYVEEDGKFIGVQPIGDTPKKFDKDYTLPYGSGAYLLAASEVYRML